MPLADTPLPAPRVLPLTSPTSTTGIALPPSLLDAAREDAAARGLNLSSLIRTLLLAHLGAVLVAETDAGPDPAVVRDAA
jgi:hypothetical protein